MAKYLNYGETATRPGTYYNYDKTGGNAVVGATDGITAILFKSNWGPLNKAVERTADEGYKDIFGDGGTTDVIALNFEGGTREGILIRVGSGGTASSVTLKGGTGSTGAVKITGKYVGSRAFTVTIKDSLSDDTVRECIIYSGTAEFEKATFEKGGDEVAALVAAFADSKNFTAEKLESATGTLADVAQSAFTNGTDPTATTSDYSNALEISGLYQQNCICIDTSDYAVISLLAAYVTRMMNNNNNIIGVAAEEPTVELATRIQHAAACNSANMVYLLNSKVVHGTYGEISGWKTAAKICGMISGTSCKYSLTHTVVSSITELLERLSEADINRAENSGCLVLTTNASKQVWIDSAITTLVTPAANQDNGWKKIRRTKTRLEVLSRCNTAVDALVGKVDNDDVGRTAIMDSIYSVGLAMIGEGKIASLTVSEDAAHPAQGDSCWFIIDVVDKDSAEHLYLRYLYRFNTSVE